jgi:hypothetical protein
MVIKIIDEANRNVTYTLFDGDSYSDADFLDGIRRVGTKHKESCHFYSPFLGHITSRYNLLILAMPRSTRLV